jgi:SAM-dependent methyltransferase
MIAMIVSLIGFLILKLLIPLLVLFTIIGIAIKFSKRLNQLWFSFFLTCIMKPFFGDVVESIRETLFKDINQLKSSDPKLRKENAIRILEIGTGEGPNLKFYPNNTRLISVDCNPTFQAYLEKNQKKFPHVKFEKIVVAKGEDMGEHVASESVDAVVIVHVLCSVDDQNAVFKEVHRVLAKVRQIKAIKTIKTIINKKIIKIFYCCQGGKAYIMEHVRYEPDKYPLSFKFQQLITPIWSLFCGGCILSRDTRSALMKAGFKQVDAKYNYFKIVPWINRPHLFGVAIK